MVLLIYMVVIIMNLVLAYNKKNSKLAVLISSVIVLVLMCGYRRPFYSDIDNYYYMYIGEQDNTVGMNFVFGLFRMLGFDFYTVHYFLLIAFWGTVLYAIVSLCSNWHFTIALMTAYYIIISADQVKNHTAFIFLILAIMCLLKNRKIKAFIFILIATSIHYSFILYLLFMLIPRRKSNIIVKISIAISIIFGFMVLLNLDTLLIHTIMPKLIGILGATYVELAALKIEMYFSTRTNMGFFLCIAFQLINYITLVESKKIIIRNGTNAQIDFVNFIININKIGFIMFPLFIYNMQWYRIIRDLLLLNYCVYSNAFNCMNKKTVNRLKYLGLITCSILIWLVGDLCLKTKPELVIIPFFENNYFL